VGCATGQEAFSIAILLKEYLNEARAVFSVTDPHFRFTVSAIEKARTGKYRGNIAEDVTPERLNRHFAKAEGGCQINKSLREMCVFTRHN
jgi:two-component system CheB/CheR fusion protein